MTIRFYLLSVLVYFLLSVSNILFAQADENTPNRTVYWVHDVNEDIPEPMTSFTPNAQSYFWRRYAGAAYPLDCPRMDATKPNNGSYFLTTRYMDPRLVNFYSDPYIPPPVLIAGNRLRNSFYHTPGLARTTAGNSKTVLQLADSVLSSSAMPEVGNLEIPLPIAVGHGMGYNLLRSVEQRNALNPQTTPRFGAVIGIGAANRGMPIINSIDNGKLNAFDAQMRDALNGGYTKLADAVNDKITSFIIGLFFKGLTEFITGEVTAEMTRTVIEAIKKAAQTAFKRDIFIGSIFNFGLDFIPTDEEFSPQSVMLKDFHNYIGKTFTLKNDANIPRPLITDLRPSSEFLNQQGQNTNTPPLPSISLNGTVSKYPYLEAALYSMPANHTQYKCVVDNPDDKVAEKFLNDAVAEYERMSVAGPLIYGGVVAAITAAKIAIALASPIPDGWGLLSAGAGVITSIPKYGEISAKFTKGAKWLKQESDFQWLNMIGATATEEYQVTVLQDPCGTSMIDNPDCLDPLQEVTVTRTRVITLPNDALVPVYSQANPREPNWKPSSTTGSNDTELNLQIRNANHFSQANHPNVKSQLNVVFDGRFTNNAQLKQAFEVGRK